LLIFMVGGKTYTIKSSILIFLVIVSDDIYRIFDHLSP
jgi:hypothetical protein